MFRRLQPEAPPEGDLIRGVARLGRRTKVLIPRLQPGEIAVIDHDDIDRLSAEGLVERKVKAVLNAAPSSTGGYPNLGPLVLVSAGIPLVDGLGPGLFDLIKEGQSVGIAGGRVLVGDTVVAVGDRVTLEGAEARLDSSKKEISQALEAFAENTLKFMAEEREVLLDAIRLPEIATSLAGRHVLVVVRGYGYKEDLDSLCHGYISDFRPVLVGVDGGADALLEKGLRPHIIIGDMDSVTTRALTCGAELVLHAYAGGGAPGQDRLDALSLPYVTFEAPGTSEDIALLLAHEKGAHLIVEVGGRASLIELLDKGRKGMASTFLVRLRVGPKLVDAKGVSELHRRGATRMEVAALIAAALITMAIIMAVSAEPSLARVAAGTFGLWLKNIWFTLRHAFG